jgi:hypothetical protein
MNTSVRRSSRISKWLIAGAGVAAIVLGGAGWYLKRHTMAVVSPFEVAGAATAPAVLIATQGSEFKNAVTAELVEALRRSSARVNVIDVSALERTRADDWDAIVLIHTWEMGKAPAAVTAFMQRTPKRKNLVVLTTSGEGTFKLADVDAISAASQMADTSARATEIMRKLEPILAARSDSRP